MSQYNIKHREISFCLLHADPEQAHSAVFLLNDLHGILMSHALNKSHIHIAYDVHLITCEEIEAILKNEGFHLDNSLMAKLKRSIVYYCEDAYRENCKKELLIKEVSENHKNDVAYLRPHKNIPCNCRDLRPEHWRKYL